MYRLKNTLALGLVHQCIVYTSHERIKCVTNHLLQPPCGVSMLLSPLALKTLNSIGENPTKDSSYIANFNGHSYINYFIILYSIIMTEQREQH